MEKENILLKTRMQLVETGGRTSQDLGAGRIVGQVLVYLYLQAEPCSLDAMCDELGLSKASVSIAARQLEQLGLVQKVWKSGDRKNYYKSAENIGSAMQQGLLTFVRQKVQLFGGELELALDQLNNLPENEAVHGDAAFLHQRVSRARKLQMRLGRFLDNPLVKFLTGTDNDKN